MRFSRCKDTFSWSDFVYESYKIVWFTDLSGSKMYLFEKSRGHGGLSAGRWQEKVVEKM